MLLVAHPRSTASAFQFTQTSRSLVEDVRQPSPADILREDLLFFRSRIAIGLLQFLQETDCRKVGPDLRSITTSDKNIVLVDMVIMILRL